MIQSRQTSQQSRLRAESSVDNHDEQSLINYNNDNFENSDGWYKRSKLSYDAIAETTGMSVREARSRFQF